MSRLSTHTARRKRRTQYKTWKYREQHLTLFAILLYSVALIQQLQIATPKLVYILNDKWNKPPLISAHPYFDGNLSQARVLSANFLMTPPVEMSEYVQAAQEEYQVVTSSPSALPSVEPTSTPTPIPTLKPTPEPTVAPTPIPNTPAPVVSHNQSHGYIYGHKTGNWYMDYIFENESGYILNRVNSIGCYGLGQDCNNALASWCPDWQTNQSCQISYWTHYMSTRYGSWKNAYLWWIRTDCRGGSTYSRCYSGHWW